MSWSMGCFPKQKSKHHCLTSLFGSHLPRRHSWRGRFCRFGSQSSRGCFATLVSVCMGAQGARLMSAGIQLPDMEVQEAPLFWGSFFAACFPSHHRGQPQGPAPTIGFSRGHFAICPPPGRVFPRGNREQAAFSKKFGKSRAVGCMFMQKLERTFAMKTQLPGAKARAGGGVGEIPGVWAFSGPVHFVCVLKVYAPGLQNIPEIPGKFRKINV